MHTLHWRVPLMSYVNLKDLAEFNKYTTGLGAGALVYIDKVEAGMHLSVRVASSSLVLSSSWA